MKHSTRPALFIALLLGAIALVRCSAAQLKADAPAIKSAFAQLCPVEGMIPIVGPVAAAACPAEDAELAAILAGPNPPTPAAKPVQVFRASPAGVLVHCGTLAPVKADAGAVKIDAGR